MIPEKTIREEKVWNIIGNFSDWLDRVRLNNQERRQIEEIVNDLREMIKF